MKRSTSWFIISLIGFFAFAGTSIFSQNLPLADGKSKWLGCVYSTNQAQRFERYWNQVTPENAGKWGSVEQSQDNMNWTTLDAAYNFAKNNEFVFRFHVLVWGNQQPNWMKNLSDAEQLEEITEWFQAVADRYPDIDYLEVVNEPLHDPPDNTGANANDMGSGNYKKALGGDNDLYGTGWDWIIKAFELARDIFPDSTKLMINDYSIPNDNSATTTYLQIIGLLQERDLIDGIGIQGHAFSTRGSMNTITNNLNRLGATGLPIQVCEMDIDGPTDETQLADYQRIFPTFWEHPAVEGITLWGWRPGLWRQSQQAYLIYDDGRGDDRPALEWLREYVANWTTSVRKQDNDLPHDFQLSQNYPNPFNPTTQIGYSIPQNGFVSLKVYDLLGNEIMTLVEGEQTAGTYSVNFDGSNLASGIYFYQIKSQNFQQTKRLTLMK